MCAKPVPSARGGAEKAPRLFVSARLGEGMSIELAAAQAHYLKHVLRLKEGAPVRLFNGRDGEWLSRLSALSRNYAQTSCEVCLRHQAAAADLHYLFAPLKHARLDYMVQKATEMGASVLQPVMTEYTQIARVNEGRMRANGVEAAEQCNMLSVPEVRGPRMLAELLDDWDRGRRLVYCDEGADIASPVEVLAALQPGSLAVLVGPEGGFSPGEREMLRRLPCVTPISLGPRVMRADTAAVAALAVVQAVIGDWRRA